MKSAVPIPVLKNLRCAHCRKFVTCGPNHVTPDSGILCGRCSRYAKPDYRNKAFEALGSMYRYPCHYWPKHCNKKLAWDEALEHERNCLFQSSCNVLCSRPGTFFKSDRKLPSKSEINLEHVTDEILQELKCAFCERYLSSRPVYIMADGKNICHRCVHSNGAPKGAIPNLAFETIASSFIFPCIYRFRGCAIRLKFGREMWGHEKDCPYGQIQPQPLLTKKQSKIIKEVGKDGKEKERGVIETHSGHIWATITPHSVPFAPPKNRNSDQKFLTSELAEVFKKKQEELKNFDVQSMDSVMSRASTMDSTADNISRDNISRSTLDNISRDDVSRHTMDNVSRTTADNISRSTADNISRDDISRSSSRIQPRTDYRHTSRETVLDDVDHDLSGYSPEHPRPSYYDPHRQSKVPTPVDDLDHHHVIHEEVAPFPAPSGYNKVPFNGYYRENIAMHGGRPSHLDQYPHLYHFPPVYHDNNPSTPVNYPGNFQYPVHGQITPKRNDSFRVGNPLVINELKELNVKRQNSSVNPREERQSSSPQPRQDRNSTVPSPREDNPYRHCNNVQDLVQTHDEVFN